MLNHPHSTTRFVLGHVMKYPTASFTNGEDPLKITSIGGIKPGVTSDPDIVLNWQYSDSEATSLEKRILYLSRQISVLWT